MKLLKVDGGHVPHSWRHQFFFKWETPTQHPCVMLSSLATIKWTVTPFCRRLCGQDGHDSRSQVKPFSCNWITSRRMSFSATVRPLVNTALCCAACTTHMPGSDARRHANMARNGHVIRQRASEFMTLVATLAPTCSTDMHPTICLSVCHQGRSRDFILGSAHLGLRLKNFWMN